MKTFSEYISKAVDESTIKDLLDTMVETHADVDAVYYTLVNVLAQDVTNEAAWQELSTIAEAFVTPNGTYNNPSYAPYNPYAGSDVYKMRQNKQAPQQPQPQGQQPQPSQTSRPASPLDSQQPAATGQQQRPTFGQRLNNFGGKVGRFAGDVVNGMSNMYNQYKQQRSNYNQMQTMTNSTEDYKRVQQSMDFLNTWANKYGMGQQFQPLLQQMTQALKTAETSNPTQPQRNLPTPQPQGNRPEERPVTTSNGATVQRPLQPVAA